jgi:hypothetical protein
VANFASESGVAGFAEGASVDGLGAAGVCAHAIGPLKISAIIMEEMLVERFIVFLPLSVG